MHHRISRRSFTLPLLVWLLLLTGGIGGAVAEPSSRMAPTGLLDEAEETELDARAHDLMERIYEGRMNEAEEIMDALLAMAPQDPRTHLLHARLLREYLSDQNTHRATIEDQSDRVQAALERAIVRSELLMQDDEDDLAGRLYRGWARMFEAQLHTLSGSYWSAGRTSKSAKSDLDVVLEIDPDQPHAQLVLGSFFYFADRLPGVLKFAAWLLRIPTGDRELGLEYLERAARSEIVGRRDAQAILGLIHFAFETRFSRALPVFEQMSDRYPANARLLEPFAMIDFYWPQRVAEDRQRLARCLTLSESGTDSLTWANAQRLRYYDLLLRIHTGEMDEARQGLENLLEDLPPQPDWLEPSVRIALADVHLLQGDLEAARSVVDSLEEDTRPEEWMRYLREDDEDLVCSAAESAELRSLQSVARALYAGRLDEAGVALDEFGDVETVAGMFYRAELHFLRDEPELARPDFETVAEREERDRWYFFRFLSRLRLAEIAATEGDFDRAQEWLEDAVERHRMKDLFRHVADGRRRLFEETDREVPTALGLANIRERGAGER